MRVEPTAESEGERVYTCLVCGAENAEVIERLSALPEDEPMQPVSPTLIPEHVHNYVVTETKEPACEEQGYTVYTCDCGESYTEYTDQLGSHQWQEVQRIPATAEAEGSVSYVCLRCEAEKTEVLPKPVTPTLIPEHVHNYVVTETIEPACEEQGYTVYTCDCGESYTEYTDQLGSHQWQEVQRIPATAEAEGSVSYVCLRCEAEKTEVLPKPELMPVTVNLLLTPEDAFLTVHPAPTEETPEPPEIPKQEDGSYLLLPGDYTWSAWADGYTPSLSVPFTVSLPEDGEALTLEITLEELAPFEQTQASSAGSVTVSAPAGVFPAGAVLVVSDPDPLPERRLLKTALNAAPVAFDSVEAAGEEIVYDEEIIESDGNVLLVNPRGAEEEYSAINETVASYRYEIRVVSEEGEALQPPEGQSVTLAFSLPEAEDPTLQVKVTHIPADGEAEELPARVENGTVYAETTGFSTFVVEFSFANLRYTVTGGWQTSVRTILEKVLPSEADSGISAVTSSDPATLAVIKQGDDWFVEPVASFDSTITLTIDFDGGYDYKITVTVPGVARIPYLKLGNTEYCTKYTRVSALRDVMGVTLKDGWYVVDQDVSFTGHRLTVLGDVHLILCDGCTLTCNYGIRTAVNAVANTRLTIYGQDVGTGYLKSSVAFESSEENKAGIGGNLDEDCGVITIYGGKIEAKAYCGGAGIGGGGHKGTSGTGIGNLRGFTMYGGEVTATGGLDGAGIGGGTRGNITGTVKVNGGVLQAYVSSEGGAKNGAKTRSAGIGGGSEMAQGGDVEIYGGTVYAEGYLGAGIGGGENGHGGHVTVAGGHVVAVSLHGAGIGGGQYRSGGTVDIRGGFVTAISNGKGAGIGGGNSGNGGTVSVSGGTVIAAGKDFKEDHSIIWLSLGNKQGNKYGSTAIGMELLANWIASMVMRTNFGGAGIGGGDGGNGGTVNITGGQLYISGGSSDTEAIGMGMKGDSDGKATISNSDVRIQYGNDINKLLDLLRTNDAQRNKILTTYRYINIFPCAHEDLIYEVVDRQYHRRVCKYCKYEEAAQPHTFDENGICELCLYNKTGKDVKYPVWYLGTQITYSNKDQYNYDPITKTLTLSGYDGTPSSLKNGAAIYAEGDLNIKANGSINALGADYGIYIKGGTLTFKENCDTFILANKYGVFAPDGLVVEKINHLYAAARNKDGVGIYYGTKIPIINIDTDLAISTPAYGKQGSVAITDKNGRNAQNVELVPGLTLTFAAGDGGLGTMQPMKGLVKDLEYTFPANGFTHQDNSSRGWTLSGWEINGQTYEPGGTFKLSADATATARWREHTHDYKIKSWEWTDLTKAQATFVCSTCGRVYSPSTGIAKEVTTQPTCETTGIRTYTAMARTPDWTVYTDKKTVVIPALGHEWGSGEVTKEATTEAPGERTYTCKRDASHKFIEEIPQLPKPLEHSLVKVKREEPTCVHPGNIEHWKCETCGALFSDEAGKNTLFNTEVTLPATRKHTPESTKIVTQAATCTEPERYRYEVKCKVCGTPLELRTGSTVSLGHDWGEWTVTKAATETETGMETRTCKRDPSHTETRTIPMLEHRHIMTKVEAVAPTCTEKGNVAYYSCSGCGKTFSDAAGKKELQESDRILLALGHTADTDWFYAGVAKEPSCTASGTGKYELICARCGETLSTREVQIPAYGHAWGEWETVKAATETAEGSEKRVCQNDGTHIETRTIPVLEHKHTLESVAEKAASCTESGSRAYYRCTGCGRFFADANAAQELDKADLIILPTGHTLGDNWVAVGSTAATCTEPGSRQLELYCKTCNALLSFRTESVPAKGHAWGEWVTTRAANEEAAGEEARTCAHDVSHTETRAIPKLAHAHRLEEVAAKASTCTEDGNIQYWHCSSCGKYFADAEGKRQLGAESIVVPATGHSSTRKTRDKMLLDPTCEESGLKLVEILCDTCGKVLESYLEETPALGHIWGEWQVTKPATETETGTEIRTCECDSSHTETRTIPMLEHKHTLTIVEAKAATCTEPGNITYWTCSSCGKLFSDAAGRTEITRDETVAEALGHSAGIWQLKEEQSASCTTTGHRSYELHCSRCGKLLDSRDDSIPALGHDWGKWVVTKEATETEKGFETRSCRRDPSHTESRSIPEKAHEHVLMKTDAAAATCTEAGNIAYWSCSGCGKLFSDAEAKSEIDREKTVIAPLGHTAEAEWRVTETKDPTCTAMGYKSLQLHCSRCDAVLSNRRETILAYGHDWGDWTVTKEATETEEGLETRTCRHDSSHTQTRAIPMKAHVHKLEHMAAAEPSCTVTGNIEYWKCSGCGKLFADAAGTAELSQEGTLIPAKGHAAEDSWLETTERSSGCEAEGIRRYELFCRNCGKLLSTRQEAIPPLEHDWGDWTVTKEATETEEGLETRICRRDSSHIETRTVPPTGHLHTLNYVAAKAATCEDFGNEAYWMCAGCGRILSAADRETELDAEDVLIAPLGHTPGTWRLNGKDREATCTEPGSTGYDLPCARCGEIIAVRDEATTALGHAWGDWTVTKEATETEEGLETRTCRRDSGHTETRAIPKLAHVHVLERTARVEPKCTVAGRIEYWTCTGCGALFTDAQGTTELEESDTVLPAKGHRTDGGENWTETVSKAATCTADGYRWFELRCLDCGELLSTRRQSDPAIGHLWGDWFTEEFATETKEGLDKRICQHDNTHTETRVVPPTGHQHSLEFVPAKAAACEDFGNEAYWMCTGCGKIFSDEEGTTETRDAIVLIRPLGHALEETWRTSGKGTEPTCTGAGEEEQERRCTRCGEIVETRTKQIPALGHAWSDWSVTREATAEEEGLETRFCAHDSTHIEIRVIPRLEHRHQMTKTEAAEPTCTVGGNIAYWTCSSCGKTFADAEGGAEIQESDIVLSPKGHSAKETWDDGDITVKPTCTKLGVKQLVLRCTRCNEPLASRAEIIPALGHDWGEPEYTWSDDFSVVIAERICSRDITHIEQEICDEIEIYELIPAACEEEGELLYFAEFENDAFDDWATEKTEPVGHDWGEWITTKEATNDEAGEWQRTCKNDPTHVETVTIPKLNHVHDLTKVEAKAPTCAGEGNKEYWVCDQGKEPCGGVFTDAEGKNELDIDKYGTLILPATGHSWKHVSTGWTDDLHSATFYFVCEKDEKHTREILGEMLEEPVITYPTPQKDGAITYVVTAFLDGQAYEAVAEEEILHASYSYTEGQNSTWLKGSGKNAVFRVVRGDGSYDLDNDALTFELFTGIEVDGQSVSSDNYTAEEGSVILSLKPAYLETLSLGWHTLKSSFIDGDATTRFLVAKPQPSPGSGSGSSQGSSSSQGSGSAGSSSGARAVTSAKTGDDSSISLWIACALVSGTLMICCVQALKHKEKRRKKTAR